MKTQVRQFNQAISWIFESFSIAMEQPDKTLSDAMSKYIIDDKCALINHGLLLAASYIYFLLPKEKSLEEIRIDNSLFETDYVNNDLSKRLRNSIAHGRIEIDKNGDIIFKDNNQNKSNPFEAKISPINFSKVIEDVGKQYANS